MENLAIGLFCLAPLGLFAAGWAACYVLMVKYRLRFERRPDYDNADIGRNAARGGQKAEAWQP